MIMIRPIVFIFIIRPRWKKKKKKSTNRAYVLFVDILKVDNLLKFFYSQRDQLNEENAYGIDFAHSYSQSSWRFIIQEF